MFSGCPSVSASFRPSVRPSLRSVVRPVKPLSNYCNYITITIRLQYDYDTTIPRRIRL